MLFDQHLEIIRHGIPLTSSDILHSVDHGSKERVGVRKRDHGEHVVVERKIEDGGTLDVVLWVGCRDIPCRIMIAALSYGSRAYTEFA